MEERESNSVRKEDELRLHCDYCCGNWHYFLDGCRKAGLVGERPGRDAPKKVVISLCCFTETINRQREREQVVVYKDKTTEQVR